VLLLAGMDERAVASAVLGADRVNRSCVGLRAGERAAVHEAEGWYESVLDPMIGLVGEGESLVSKAELFAIRLRDLKEKRVSRD
jgi:hypothetical protein